MDGEWRQLWAQVMLCVSSLVPECDQMLFQSSISGVTAAYNREQLWLANEGLITKLQACCRGYLVRQEFRSRMNFLKKQIPAITCIQVLPTASGPLEQEE